MTVTASPNINEPFYEDQKFNNRWWSFFNSLRGQGFSGTVTTAKLTTGGANGSMVFVNGVLTSITPAT